MTANGTPPVRASGQGRHGIGTTRCGGVGVWTVENRNRPQGRPCYALVRSDWKPNGTHMVPGNLNFVDCREPDDF